ncbi:MAG: LysR family transcriptional regulator of abg operon [Enterobacterales bacterium]|jgi:LysR family transcriptional regulator of abg operon
MNFQDIRYVQAICENGSFLRASSVLNITQPTLSKRIERIEHKLNAILFIRSKGKSKPTSLALFMADRATLILKEMSVIESEIKSHAAGTSGCIRLGVGPVPLRRKITSVIKLMKANYPDINLEIVTGNASNVVELLSAGELDAVICQESVDSSIEQMNIIKQIESEIILVTKPDHPLSTIKNLKFHEAFSYPAALPFISKAYQTYISKNYDINIDQVSNKVTCSEYSILLQLVMEENYFSLGPLFAFESELSKGNIVKLDITIPVIHKVVILTNRNMYMTPARINFLDILSSELT